MNTERLRKREQAIAARDTARTRRWAENKADIFHLISNYSITPQLERLMFAGMLAVPFLAATSDVKAFFTYQYMVHDKMFLLNNLSHSLLLGWVFFAFFVVLFSATLLKSDFTNPYFNRFRFKRDGEKRNLPQKYKRHIVIAVSGSLLFLLYAATISLIS